MSPTCHYCGEQFDSTTDLEKSYAEDPSEHNVCSGCLTDVIAFDETIEPLPEYRDDVEEADLDE